MKPGLPVWRSLLYVPATVEKYVDKAHTRGADCIQVDLEDSVPAADKDRARTLVPAVAARVRRGGADVVGVLGDRVVAVVQPVCWRGGGKCF